LIKSLKRFLRKIGKKSFKGIYAQSKHALVCARDVPDSGGLVLPAGNCVTGEYRYRPVKRVPTADSDIPQTAAGGKPRSSVDRRHTYISAEGGAF